MSERPAGGGLALVRCEAEGPRRARRGHEKDGWAGQRGRAGELWRVRSLL